MRRRIVRVLACLLVLLAAPAALAALAFGLPAQYGETYLAGLPLKWDRLRQTEGPRIILVGGSGADFDVRCDLLEGELPGYEAVNFGLYAGLGTGVMLDLAVSRVRAGDVVVFMPELSGQTLSAYFGAEAMWQAAEGRPDLLAALPPSYYTPLLGAFPAFAGAKTRLYLENAAPPGDGIYARRSFNGYGDIAAGGREANVMPGGFDENMPLRFDPAIVSDALAARLRCPLLGDPSDSLMDPGWFFDTNFHLNAAGAVAATACLAADLKAALGDPTPVSIELPAMPTLADAALTRGDNGDENCFLYAAADGGVRITGLTPAGAARETLTVPVSHDGLPVTGFDAAVFAGNGTLGEIVLQENIRSIPDGAFAGCSRLTRLTLRNPDPETCAPGPGLLEGTEAMIYVPADRVSAYCTSYFWAVHAGRIRPDGAAGPGPSPTTAPARTGPNRITYLGNGGTLRRQEGDSLTRPADTAHLRVNTLAGTAYFAREGCVFLGWSRGPDGGGLIGPGSRTEREPGLTLFAQWAEANPAADFDWTEADGEAQILGYHGTGDACVVPETLGGLPVGTIRAGAFRGETFRSLVLPSSLRCLEAGAFRDCVIEELTLFDSLTELGDDSFAGGEKPRTLHVGAAVSPVFSGSYYDTFSDKYDRLLSLAGERKLVLASGSSGRYGYDSPRLEAAFPAYAVVNMGVYAYSNARPQLELILGLMGEGDVLLSTPEFDAVPEQFCVSDRLDHHFWAMMESNYDAVSRLDLRTYEGVYDSFAEYQRIRGGMEAKSYGVSPAAFDDDGNRYDFATYNGYGDFILPRPNGSRDARQHTNTADYTAASFPPETVERLNGMYRKFLDRGIAVYFTYTPRNRSSLTEDSTPEARRALQEYLAASLCVPVISDVEDYLLSGVYFWKIDSHTSTEGTSIRTDRVIADLRAVLP